MENRFLASISLGEESHQMWSLNKRLEAYLSKVKALEEENGLLRAEIVQLRSNKSERCLKKKVLHEMRTLREVLDDSHAELMRAEADRDSVCEEIDYIKERCLQERQAQEEAKIELSKGKKILEEERQAQSWLKERLLQLEGELEDIIRDHEQEKELMEQEISSISQRLQNFKVAPVAFPPVNVDDYANKLSEIWRGAVEGYKSEVSMLETSLSDANENLRKVVEENRQSKIHLHSLEKELQTLKTRKELLEEILDTQMQEQQEEDGKLQLEIEELEQEKLDLRAQISQILEDRQQLMHLKMSLSLEVATYRSLLEAEGARVHSPGMDYKLSFSDSMKDQKIARQRQDKDIRKLLSSSENRLSSSKKQRAEQTVSTSSSNRFPNVKTSTFERRKPSPVTKEFQKVSSVLQSQSLNYAKAPIGKPAPVPPKTDSKSEKRAQSEDVSGKQNAVTISNSYSFGSSETKDLREAKKESKDKPVTNEQVYPTEAKEPKQKAALEKRGSDSQSPSIDEAPTSQTKEDNLEFTLENIVEAGQVLTSSSIEEVEQKLEKKEGKLETQFNDAHQREKIYADIPKQEILDDIASNLVYQDESGEKDNSKGTTSDQITHFIQQEIMTSHVVKSTKEEKVLEALDFPEIITESGVVSNLDEIDSDRQQEAPTPQTTVYATKEFELLSIDNDNVSEIIRKTVGGLLGNNLKITSVTEVEYVHYQEDDSQESQVFQIETCEDQLHGVKGLEDQWIESVDISVKANQDVQKSLELHDLEQKMAMFLGADTQDQQSDDDRVTWENATDPEKPLQQFQVFGVLKQDAKELFETEEEMEQQNTLEVRSPRLHNTEEQRKFSHDQQLSEREPDIQEEAQQSLVFSEDKQGTRESFEIEHAIWEQTQEKDSRLEMNDRGKLSKPSYDKSQNQNVADVEEIVQQSHVLSVLKQGSREIFGIEEASAQQKQDETRAFVLNDLEDQSDGHQIPHVTDMEEPDEQHDVFNVLEPGTTESFEIKHVSMKQNQEDDISPEINEMEEERTISYDRQPNQYDIEEPTQQSLVFSVFKQDTRERFETEHAYGGEQNQNVGEMEELVHQIQLFNVLKQKSREFFEIDESSLQQKQQGEASIEMTNVEEECELVKDDQQTSSLSEEKDAQQPDDSVLYNRPIKPEDEADMLEYEDQDEKASPEANLIEEKSFGLTSAELDSTRAHEHKLQLSEGERDAVSHFDKGEVSEEPSDNGGASQQLADEGNDGQHLSEDSKQDYDINEETRLQEAQDELFDPTETRHLLAEDRSAEEVNEAPSETELYTDMVDNEELDVVSSEMNLEQVSFTTKESLNSQLELLEKVQSELSEEDMRTEEFTEKKGNIEGHEVTHTKEHDEENEDVPQTGKNIIENTEVTERDTNQEVTESTEIMKVAQTEEHVVENVDGIQTEEDIKENEEVTRPEEDGKSRKIAEYEGNVAFDEVKTEDRVTKTASETDQNTVFKQITESEEHDEYEDTTRTEKNVTEHEEESEENYEVLKTGIKSETAEILFQGVTESEERFKENEEAMATDGNFSENEEVMEANQDVLKCGEIAKAAEIAFREETESEENVEEESEAIVTDGNISEYEEVTETNEDLKSAEMGKAAEMSFHKETTTEEHGDKHEEAIKIEQHIEEIEEATNAGNEEVLKKDENIEFEEIEKEQKDDITKTEEFTEEENIEGQEMLQLGEHVKENEDSIQKAYNVTENEKVTDAEKGVINTAGISETEEIISLQEITYTDQYAAEIKEAGQTKENINENEVTREEEKEETIRCEDVTKTEENVEKNEGSNPEEQIIELEEGTATEEEIIEPAEETNEFQEVAKTEERVEENKETTKLESYSIENEKGTYEKENVEESKEPKIMENIMEDEDLTFEDYMEGKVVATQSRETTEEYESVKIPGENIDFDKIRHIAENEGSMKKEENSRECVEENLSDIKDTVTKITESTEENEASTEPEENFEENEEITRKEDNTVENKVAKAEEKAEVHEEAAKSEENIEAREETNIPITDIERTQESAVKDGNIERSAITELHMESKCMRSQDGEIIQELDSHVELTSEVSTEKNVQGSFDAETDIERAEAEFNDHALAQPTSEDHGENVTACEEDMGQSSVDVLSSKVSHGHPELGHEDNAVTPEDHNPDLEQQKESQNIVNLSDNEISESEESLDSQEEVSLLSQRSEEFESYSDYHQEKTLPDTTPLPNLDIEFEDVPEEKADLTSDRTDMTHVEEKQSISESEKHSLSTDTFVERTHEEMEEKESTVTIHRTEEYYEGDYFHTPDASSEDTLNQMKTSYLTESSQCIVEERVPEDDLCEDYIASTISQKFVSQIPPNKITEEKPTNITGGFDQDLNGHEKDINEGSDNGQTEDKSDHTNDNETDIIADIHSAASSQSEELDHIVYQEYEQVEGKQTEDRAISEGEESGSSDEGSPNATISLTSGVDVSRTTSASELENILLEHEDAEEEHKELITAPTDIVQLEYYTSDPEEVKESSDFSYILKRESQEREKAVRFDTISEFTDLNSAKAKPVNGQTSHEEHERLDWTADVLNGHSERSHREIEHSCKQGFILLESDHMYTHNQEFMDDSVISFAMTEGKSEGLFQSLIETSQQKLVISTEEIHPDSPTTTDPSVYLESNEESRHTKQVQNPYLIEKDFSGQSEVISIQSRLTDEDAATVTKQQGKETHEGTSNLRREEENSWSSDD